MKTSDLWQLTGTAAQLKGIPLRAQVRLDAPERGVEQLLGPDAIASPCRILCWRPQINAASPAKLVEGYVRGADLIATYAALPPQTVQPQIYWRALHESSLQAVGVELIVSVQTSLLDSNPESVVVSEVPPGDAWRLIDLQQNEFAPIVTDEDASTVHRPVSAAPSLLVLRPSDETFSYAEMIHPSDFVAVNCQLDVAGEPRLRLTTRLFPERLEKGVIRRGRVCGWFVPREGDLQIAGELFRRFVAEPPPLTT